MLFISLKNWNLSDTDLTNCVWTITWHGHKEARIIYTGGRRCKWWDKEDRRRKENETGNNQGLAGGQFDGQKWRLWPLWVTKVGQLIGEMDMGSVGQLIELMRTTPATWSEEQESKRLPDGAGVRRITDFRQGPGQVSTWSWRGH